MFKFVLRDYQIQFRDSIKNMDSGVYFIYIYILCFVPMWTQHTDNYWSDWSGLLCYYSFFIPLCIGLFLSRLYPNRMSKTLLLCPMSMQQKKQYIRTGFVIRVVFPYGLFLLLEGATMLVMLNHRLVHASEIVLWAAKAWILLLSLISVNIYCQPIDPIPYVMGRKYRLPGNYEIWNILVQLLAIFGGMILGSALTDQKSETVFDIVVDLILVAIITALCIKIIVTYAGPVMEQAVSCEYRPRLEKERKRG